MKEVRAGRQKSFIQAQQKKIVHYIFPSLTAAYLAVVNAACERAPMIYPRAVSDGQFYSPPESVAGDLCLLVYSLCVYAHFLIDLQTDV